MIRILANDGIDDTGKKMLEDAGISVDTNKIEQDRLAEKLNDYDGILVRSATTVRKDLIDQCPNLKFIGRAGVGMDNIDVEYARSKGLEVANTPAASSQSVAELAFAHLFSGIRYLHDSNRKMPAEGVSNFKGLKKSYADGRELKGKTLGIIGFGGIGQEVAKMALGLGMNILVATRHPHTEQIELELGHPANQKITVNIELTEIKDVLKHSDFITFHIPFSKGQEPVISMKEIKMMKEGAGIINTARGGVAVEDDILQALDDGRLSFYGVDVFEGEPKPSEVLIKHPKVSCTPHIGASTGEAQERIGVEMAEKIIRYFKS